jgi:hypothetical protein
MFATTAVEAAPAGVGGAEVAEVLVTRLHARDHSPSRTLLANSDDGLIADTRRHMLEFQCTCSHAEAASL